ncbi:MAG: valine--tRNA ligase [Clostridia bacterium]|nr:valine--tRNA ligase [Clostridia bacterium]
MQPLSSLSTTYDPHQVEQKWYQYWMDHRLFRAEVDEEGRPFSMVIPPPNVTGSLHLGHALNNTLQDILIRWRRMQGYNALWVPGTDHAGIATQARVEENLAKEGLKKEDLGREKFLERVWQWKHEYGNRIVNQLKLLGCSCDWSRERFTMDEGCSRAVREVFVRLYEKGLIYRGNYIINWCPKCHTTISDIEVDHEDTPGHLYHLCYPFADGPGYVEVATTRPETMLGDTAVAVHPEDERYRDIVGRTLILPLVGRRIPVIADAYVDPSFGTGAVKVTPAHDPNDFEMGQRHHLPQVRVINWDGTMAEEAGPYAGMDRYECRRKIVEDLQAIGSLTQIEDYMHAVGHCYRCHTVIEPLVSKQWFVRMKPLAEPAIQAVKEGKIRFVPERFTRLYINWLENIRDWCISRQLWWGHRIPVWYCQECGREAASRIDLERCPNCGSKDLVQDPDVLDTWFSSALWPFSTLGWPDSTPELGHFYPTSVLVTGRDIIFFWVARMIFMGLEFTGQEPFSDVLIHGLVLDAEGRKMSKSLGNGIDPIEVIQEYGADTLRLTLVTGNTPGNDLRFRQERLERARNFTNKIWNASRFVLMNLDGFEPGHIKPQYTLADRWILSRFARVAQEVTASLEAYEIGNAADLLYEFFWNQFCDWYIELAKPRLYGENEAEKRTTQLVLWYVLKHTLELLHPFLPFLTEEIWQKLPHEGVSIMAAPWPEPEAELLDPQAEEDMAVLMDIIRTYRNLRAEFALPPGRKLPLVLMPKNERAKSLLAAHQGYVAELGWADPITVVSPDGGQKPSQAIVGVAAGAEVYLPLKGTIDIEKERERLARELRSLEKDLAAAKRKLANPDFLSKAPVEVVAKEKAKAEELVGKKEAISRRLGLISSWAAEARP